MSLINLFARIFGLMIKLFIGGFPLDMDELQLVQLVAPYADVVTIKLVRDRATKKCKGYGFIEVPDETHALNVISELNGRQLGDRELTLNFVPEAPSVKSVPVYRKLERAPMNMGSKRPRRPRI